MDCRTFKKKHAAFLDDTLPGIETAAMQEHLRVCARCAGHDAGIRRSLLLLRNLPPLEVSSDFTQRLRARIAVEQQRHTTSVATFHARGPSLGAFLGVACGLIAVGVLTLAVASHDVPPAPVFSVRTAPAAAITSAVEDQTKLADGNVAAPAYVASMSTGMPMWPALLLAEEGSLRFATAELRTVSDRAPEP
jgi:anti-sigma factor RsiW